MIFSFYEEFSEFRIFKGFKSLLSDWWSLDILLIEKNSKEFFYNPKTQIYNEITKTLLSSNLFKEDLIKSLDAFSNQKLDSNEIYTVTWRQVGSDIFAIPVIIEGSLEGFVVATGFMPHSRDRLSAVLDYLKKEKSWQEKEIAKLKKPSQRDLEYLKKLLCILVKESFALYKQKKKQNELLEKLDQIASKPAELIGKSIAMQFLYNILDKTKASDKSFLIQGELGTGKKLIAKIIHEASLRKENFFQILDCSILNESSLKAELFGKAIPEQLGLLDKATQGTLVLDKIENLSLNLQAKILEFLEEGTFFQVGNTRKPRKSKARLLALSSVDLKDALQKGDFREDLYYKLNIMNLRLPPLRDRAEDIPLLIRHFVENKFPEKNKNFSPKVMRHFFNYHWPKNIKELQNEIEKMIVLSGEEETLITENHLSSRIYESKDPALNSTSSLKQSLNEFEKKIILDCLEKENWNKSSAAKKLNLSRTALIYKAKLYGILEKKEA